MSPIWNSIDHLFHKNLIYPHGITLALRFGRAGDVILKDILSRPFNYATQNCYPRILIRCVWELVRGSLPSNHFLTNKKGTSPSNFPSSEPFFKFLQQQMVISKFPSDIIQENMRFGGGVSTLSSLSILKRKLEILITNPMSPNQKFIQSHFLYKAYISPGHNLHPFSWGLKGGGVIFNDIISGLLWTK